MVISLFVGIYVARYLGPERYGLLSYTMSFVWLFSAFLDLGHREIIVRELVLYPEQRNVILGSAILLRSKGHRGRRGYFINCKWILQRCI